MSAKSFVIYIRVTAEEREAIWAQAAAEKMTMNNFVRGRIGLAADSHLKPLTKAQREQRVQYARRRKR